MPPNKAVLEMIENPLSKNSSTALSNIKSGLPAEDQLHHGGLLSVHVMHEDQHVYHGKTCAERDQNWILSLQMSLRFTKKNQLRRRPSSDIDVTKCTSNG